MSASAAHNTKIGTIQRRLARRKDDENWPFFSFLQCKLANFDLISEFDLVFWVV